VHHFFNGTSGCSLVTRGHKGNVGQHLLHQTVATNERGMASHAPSSAPASRGRSGVPPTAAEWEQLRLLFTRLYVEENTTLKEIRQILARDHGFHATFATTNKGSSVVLLISCRERMYKSRITQWGIGKNNKVSWLSSRLLLLGATPLILVLIGT